MLQPLARLLRVRARSRRRQRTAAADARDHQQLLEVLQGEVRRQLLHDPARVGDGFVEFPAVEYGD